MCVYVQGLDEAVQSYANEHEDEQRLRSTLYAVGI